MPMETYKIETSRGIFNVRDRGNKDGFPVVMIHGWPESSYCWEGVARDLDPRLRIIAPDLRGLGDSERTLDVNAYQKKELAKDIQQVIQALGIDSFFLVGHDWGGVVAQETALLMKDQVKKLVVMNIPIISNAKGEAEGIKTLFSQGAVPLWYQYFLQVPGLAEGMIEGKEHIWVPIFFGRAVAEGTISQDIIDEYIRCYKIKNTPFTGAALYRATPQDAKRRAELKGTKFPMPTLYIYGKRDPVVIPQFLNHMEECFDSLIVEHLDAGHFVQEEKAQEVAQLLNGFLQ